MRLYELQHACTIELRGRKCIAHHGVGEWEWWYWDLLEWFLSSNGMVNIEMRNVAMTLDFWNFGLQTL